MWLKCAPLLLDLVFAGGDAGRMGFARLEGKNPRDTGCMPGFFHRAGP